MRKVLIGALVVCLCLGVSGMAMAADISWSGSAELGITGTSDGASGTFAGSAGLDVEATASSGQWSATVAFADFGLDDGYLTYSGEAFDLTLDADGINNGIYDVECASTATLGIPSNPGLKLDVPMEGFGFYAIVNNELVGGEVKYNFAGGVDITRDALGFGLTFNSDGRNKTSSYGVQVTYSAGAMSLTGQYGSFNPDGGDAGTGYAAIFGYTLAGGSSLGLEYYGADEALNSSDGVPRDAYSKIYGEFVTPLAESVDLTLDVTSKDKGTGDTVTSWEGKIGFSL